MTIDEVIEREQYSAEANREMADTYHTDENIYLKEEEAFRNREDYHRQLAEWLRELKLYREILIDRPCEVCKFHETGSCSRWDCVFEEVNADGSNRCED